MADKMGRGRPPKKVNQRFFNRESRRMFYVLGAFYGGCTLYNGDKSIVFRDSKKDLVEIVKREIESEHKITSDPREKSSHWLTMMGAPRLYAKLKKLGLGRPKQRRKFPRDIDEVYISHFVRGFLDAQGVTKIVYKPYSTRTELYIRFNRLFLVRLNDTLQKYANVQRTRPLIDNVHYAHRDVLRIHDFIYSDWNFIEKNGLYLPSKKESFVTENQGEPICAMTIKSGKKVEKAKEMLLKGRSVDYTAKRTGYLHTKSLHKAFEKITGQTITEFLQDNK